jgi:hypothetical protein
MNKKIKSLVATSTILVLLSACASISSSNVGNITSSIVSSAQVSVEQPLALNQIELVAVEVDKLPNRVVYTPTDVVSTSGGMLRLSFSDYSVRYVSMNDSMLELSRLNISSPGRASITIKYTYKDKSIFTTYPITIVPFMVQPTGIEIDIKESDVLFEQKVDLDYIISPINAKYDQVVWSSSNELIATVDQDGVVTPRNQGEVIISASVDGKFTSSSRLNILPMTPKEFIPNPTFVGLLAQQWIPLSTAADLAAIDDNLTGTSYTFAANTPYQVVISNTSSVNMLDKNYFLINNIDLSSIGNWTPLGTFTGELDGMNYNISNMRIISPNYNLGLFSQLNQANIQNINFLNSKITLRIEGNVLRNNFGTLAGITTSSTISNILIDSSSNLNVDYTVATGLTDANKPSAFGGLTGLVNGTTVISNLKVYSSISGLERTGGFIGSVESITSLNISDSLFEGNFVVNNTNNFSASSLGGLIGRVLSSGQINISKTIVNSNINFIDGTSILYGEVGGFIGILLTAAVNITESGFKGTIKANVDIAKFIGRVFTTPNITILNSYAIGDIVSRNGAIASLVGFGRLGSSSNVLSISNVYAIGNITANNPRVAEPSNRGSNVGILVASNGDNNGDAKGTISFNKVYVSSANVYNPTPILVIGVETATRTSVAEVFSINDNNLKNSASYIGWDFVNIWRINPNINNGYPYLAWEE